MIFKDLWVLFFAPLVILLIYFVKKRDAFSSLRFSAQELLGGARPTLRLRLARNQVFLRALAVLLFLVALARPRIPIEEARVESEGVDIVLAIDASGSMLAEDFTIGGIRRNRLYVVKGVVEDFILERRSDRIGMVAFAARAYTVCPLTLDYDWLIQNLKRVEIGAIEDGTAIGSAISSSLNRLKTTEAKSKIVILLTDGINNSGRISPLTAAEAAKALGIKIYTIGVGTKGPVPYPVQQVWGRTIYKNVEIEIDEEALKKIAVETNAKYYRATDTESLREIYKEIDSLERTPVQQSGFQEYQELFDRFLLFALAILVLELVLSNTILRKIP
ncbi:MAG: VWA domain-containing protein [Candidatus Omnitrophica bacterium]|nr:VWA domain-containing protein [Candidatus Omnitrophota bacterium]